MIKILHCGDIHLDSPLTCHDHAVGERLRDSLRETFLDMLVYARAEGVDLILIAGDLFDTGYIRKQTIEELTRVLSELPIPVVISPGNHDPYRKTGAYAALAALENVYVFSSEELQRFDLDEIGVSVSGYAFTSDRLETSPLQGDYSLSESNINILCAHADLFTPLSKYAPLLPAELERSGFSYAALGHVHKAPAPKSYGRTLCAYCGFTQGRSYDEPGDGGAMLVTIDDEGRVVAEKKLFSKSRYVILPLDVAGAEREEDIIRLLGEAILRAGYGAETSLRVLLEGAVSPDCQIREERITAALTGPAQIELRNNTLPVLDIAYLETDPTIKGEFYRALRDRLYSENEYDRKAAALALKLGLSALDGRPVGREEL